jgi:hypothetical protein
MVEATTDPWTSTEVGQARRKWFSRHDVQSSLEGSPPNAT